MLRIAQATALPTFRRRLIKVYVSLTQAEAMQYAIIIVAGAQLLTGHDECANLEAHILLQIAAFARTDVEHKVVALTVLVDQHRLEPVVVRSVRAVHASTQAESQETRETHLRLIVVELARSARVVCRRSE